MHNNFCVITVYSDIINKLSNHSTCVWLQEESVTIACALGKGESFAPGRSHPYLGVTVLGSIDAQAPLTGGHSRLGVSDRESLTTGVIHAGAVLVTLLSVRTAKLAPIIPFQFGEIIHSSASTPQQHESEVAVLHRVVSLPEKERSYGKEGYIAPLILLH